jgi:L-asparaginase
MNHETTSRRRIYIAYTGGTIGMCPSPNGYVPAADFLADHLATMPEFHRPEMPDFTLKEYRPLMDSSDMNPTDWQHIADDIAAHYDQYDGFVILHGTDTMAFTASALSFMLEELGKPVIITGSQIPLAQLRSDGHANLLNALYVAAFYPIAEVGLYFNNRLYRGNRCIKAHADGFNAFDSPNFPPLLEAGIAIQPLAGELTNTDVALRLQVKAITPQPIAVATLYPGICVEVLDNMLQRPIRALVLQSFGVGNAPQDCQFLSRLKAACDDGVVVVNCTQCNRGMVSMGDYAGGNALAEAGVVSGRDMTLEAVLTKLHYLLSQGVGVQQVRLQIGENLRGELTPLDG